MSKQKNIAIVGAGLVGSLWAVYMAKRGHRVTVFDRRNDIRTMKVVQGKSINLALSDRGWRGLEGAGIRQEIERVALPMAGRKMHARDGTLTYQPYGKEDQAIYSVSRGLLNQTLVECADRFEQVELRFNHRCLDVNIEKNELVFVKEDTNETVLPFLAIFLR